MRSASTRGSCARFGPLLFRPGAVTRDYLAGRRVAHVPPLRTYLISALVFFGLFSIFPNRARVDVFTTGESRPTGGTRVTSSCPLTCRSTMPGTSGWSPGRRRIRRPSWEPWAPPCRARSSSSFRSSPCSSSCSTGGKAYFVDHLVFSLYYHAFVFLVLSALFLVSRTDAWLPGSFRALVTAGLSPGWWPTCRSRCVASTGDRGGRPSSSWPGWA